MVDIGEEDLDYADRIAGDADILKSAWQETIDDMEALAGELEAEGWDVFHVAAGDTATAVPDAGDDDLWGLVHVIPDNFVEGFEEAFAAGDYPEYDVFRQEVEGRVFEVTLYRDPDAGTAILIASQFLLFEARGLVRKSKSEGHTFSHVRTLDGTLLGSFRHDEPAKFFPHYEEFDDRYDVDPGPGGTA